LSKRNIQTGEPWQVIAKYLEIPTLLISFDGNTFGLKWKPWKNLHVQPEKNHVRFSSARVLGLVNG
jgi:hypothetical protein